MLREQLGAGFSGCVWAGERCHPGTRPSSPERRLLLRPQTHQLDPAAHCLRLRFLVEDRLQVYEPQPEEELYDLVGRPAPRPPLCTGAGPRALPSVCVFLGRGLRRGCALVTGPVGWGPRGGVPAESRAENRPGLPLCRGRLWLGRGGSDRCCPAGGAWREETEREAPTPPLTLPVPPAVPGGGDLPQGRAQPAAGEVGRGRGQLRCVCVRGLPGHVASVADGENAWGRVRPQPVWVPLGSARQPYGEKEESPPRPVWLSG